MKFTRRDAIKGMGAAGLTPLLINGCSSDGGGSSLPPLPDLPEYMPPDTLGPANMFEHGVASGDPLPNGVILWTRVSPEGTEPIEVWWEMSLDPEFTQRTAQGTSMTDPSRDFTVKIDVRDLIWGRNYYYRFFAQGIESPTGRTRLAPTGDQASRLRFGVCSCSNYGFGYFHSYRHMAERADLDAVLHLGDYFYEYGNGIFPGPDDQLRMLEPETETVTLSDYRTRFSLYRRDPDLQEAHRQHPFIVVWDDHETANNSWSGGAQNHDPETEGPWDDRVAAARQAFFEWIPIRETPGQRLYRALEYGDLADVIMLDTRIDGREEQFSVRLYDPDEPDLPENLLGADQETWLQEQLSSSTARWKVLGNQVVMSFWNVTETPPLIANPDQWTGYPGTRDRTMSFLRDNEVSNVVVVTGDVHSSWAMDVTVGDGSYDAATQEGAVAVEFVAPGITSPFDFQGFAQPIAEASPHVQYADDDNIGYFILDLQADKAQADWYFAEGLEQSQTGQTFGAAYATMVGESKVMEMSMQEPDEEDAPPLAPA